MNNKDKLDVVVATTPDDSHSWNMHGVELELIDRGLRVLNLGPCTPIRLVAETLRDFRPQLLVITTVNGHGAASMPELMAELAKFQLLKSTSVIVGGILTVDVATASEAEKSINALGCSGVFTGDDAWRRFDLIVMPSLRIAPLA